MTTVRRLAAVAGLWLAVAVAVAPAPAHAAPTTRPCSGVTVSVEFGALGGRPQTACVARAGDAAKVFAAAGFHLAYAPNMQDFVCTIDGVPDDRPCTSGTSYWSLWWSPGDKGWTYATLGVKSLDVAAGDSLAFVWHQGGGRAKPPALAVGAASQHTRVAPREEPKHSSSTGTWLAVIAGVVVLGGAAGVPLLRRLRAG